MIRDYWLYEGDKKERGLLRRQIMDKTLLVAGEGGHPSERSHNTM